MDFKRPSRQVEVVTPGPDGALNFAPSEKERIARRLNSRIDAALQAEVEKEKVRGYLGGSRLGLECDRRLAFEYQFQAEAHRRQRLGESLPTKFPGRLIRRFRMGNWCEEEVAQWLLMAGVALDTVDKDGKQFGWSTYYSEAAGRDIIAGHIDGIICDDAGIGFPTPCLWENKVMKASIWRAFVKHGLAETQPVYYGQVQVYMAYQSLADGVDYENTLFTAMNADTSELAVEVVPYNARAAQAASDRGVRVVEARSPADLARIATSRDSFACKFCDFKDDCWSMPQ